jgi:ATP-dependent RNA helicase HelY
MTVNLIRNYSREEARHLLNSSFAQFLADRGVVSLERQLERDRAFLEGYHRSMACHMGDFVEYWRLRERAERIREDARRSRHRTAEEETRTRLGSLRPGDVIALPGARRRGLAVVVGGRQGQGRPTVLTEDRRSFRVGPSEFEREGPPAVLARIDLPRSGSTRSARYRRDVAGQLAALTVRPGGRPRRQADPDAERRAAEVERQAAAHPCASCHERPTHERWAERASKLDREIAGLERRIRARTETLGKRFDRVVAVLEELGYVRSFSLTEKGEGLRRIYGEGDILVAEGLAAGLFDELSPSEMAALVSTLVYESRERTPRRAEFPTGTLRDRFQALSGLWADVRRVEDAHQVELCRELDAGFVATAFQWAEAKPLEDVLASSGMTPGDFVRNCKQLLDLLRQVEGVAGPGVAPVARAARGAIDRSVVAYTGVEA